jgi:hypothetical protein
VYPHGLPDEAVTATVDLISGNGRAIAVRLNEKPPWCRVKNGFLLHEDFRIAMFLSREAIDDQPVGPWIEIMGGGLYEIDREKPALRRMGVNV